MYVLYASLVLAVLVFFVGKIIRDYVLSELESMYEYIEDEIDDVYALVDRYRNELD